LVTVGGLTVLLNILHLALGCGVSLQVFGCGLGLGFLFFSGVRLLGIGHFGEGQKKGILRVRAKMEFRMDRNGQEMMSSDFDVDFVEHGLDVM
jgi:hypothetical protein